MGRPCRRESTDRDRRKGVTVGILLGIAGSFLLLLPEIQNQWGEDYRFFVGVADRWLATGAFL